MSFRSLKTFIATAKSTEPSVCHQRCRRFNEVLTRTKQLNIVSPTRDDKLYVLYGGARTSFGTQYLESGSDMDAMFEGLSNCVADRLETEEKHHRLQGGMGIIKKVVNAPAAFIRKVKGVRSTWKITSKYTSQMGKFSKSYRTSLIQAAFNGKLTPGTLSHLVRQAEPLQTHAITQDLDDNANHAFELMGTVLENEIKNDSKRPLGGAGSMYSLIQKYILSPASKVWGFIKHNWLNIITVLFLLYLCVGAYFGFAGVNQILLGMVKQAWVYLKDTSLGSTVCPWLEKQYVFGSCVAGKLFGLTPPGSSDMCFAAQAFAQEVAMKAAVDEATVKAAASASASGFQVGTAVGGVGCSLLVASSYMSSFFTGPLGVMMGVATSAGCSTVVGLTTGAFGSSLGVSVGAAVGTEEAKAVAIQYALAESAWIQQTLGQYLTYAVGTISAMVLPAIGMQKYTGQLEGVANTAVAMSQDLNAKGQMAHMAVHATKAKIGRAAITFATGIDQEKHLGDVLIDSADKINTSVRENVVGSAKSFHGRAVAQAEAEASFRSAKVSARQIMQERESVTQNELRDKQVKWTQQMNKDNAEASREGVTKRAMRAIEKRRKTRAQQIDAYAIQMKFRQQNITAEYKKNMAKSANTHEGARHAAQERYNKERRASTDRVKDRQTPKELFERRNNTFDQLILDPGSFTRAKSTKNFFGDAIVTVAGDHAGGTVGQMVAQKMYNTNGKQVHSTNKQTKSQNKKFNKKKKVKTTSKKKKSKKTKKI